MDWLSINQYWPPPHYNFNLMNPSSSFIPSNSNKQQTEIKVTNQLGGGDDRDTMYDDYMRMVTWLWYDTIPSASWWWWYHQPIQLINTTQRLILKFIHAIHLLVASRLAMLDRHILCPVKQQNTHIKEIVLVACHNLQNTYVCIRHISLQTVPDYKRKSFFLSLSMRSTSRSGHFWKKK